MYCLHFILYNISRNNRGKRNTVNQMIYLITIIYSIYIRLPNDNKEIVCISAKKIIKCNTHKQFSLS